MTFPVVRRGDRERVRGRQPFSPHTGESLWYAPTPTAWGRCGGADGDADGGAPPSRVAGQSARGRTGQPTLTKSSQPDAFTDLTFPEIFTRIGSFALPFFHSRKLDSASVSEWVVIWQYSKIPCLAPPVL